jgi:MFS family permease
VLQGLATAMALPTALSLLTTSFAEGALRERALGMNGALLSGGFTVGALVGGVLVSALGWRAAFFINVPVAVAIMVVTPLVVADSVRTHRSRLDVPGAITVTSGLLALVYGVVERHLGTAVVGVALLAAFVVVELRADAPLVPLRILRRPTVKWGNLAGFAIFTTEPAMIFLMTLYLQEVLHLTPLATGLVFGVPGLASVAAGVLAGRIVGRVGRRLVLVVAMAVQGLAIVPLLAVGFGPAALAIVVPSLFVGFFGHVAAIVAFTVTATSGLPDDEQGLATGLTSMTQQVAITVGIPVLGAVAATQADQLDGIRLALGVAVVAVLGTAGLVGFGLRGQPG